MLSTPRAARGGGAVRGRCPIMGPPAKPQPPAHVGARKPATSIFACFPCFPSAPHPSTSAAAARESHGNVALGEPRGRAALGGATTDAERAPPRAKMHLWRKAAQFPTAAAPVESPQPRTQSHSPSQSRSALEVLASSPVSSLGAPPTLAALTATWKALGLGDVDVPTVSRSSPRIPNSHAAQPPPPPSRQDPRTAWTTAREADTFAVDALLRDTSIGIDATKRVGGAEDRYTEVGPGQHNDSPDWKTRFRALTRRVRLRRRAVSSAVKTHREDFVSPRARALAEVTCAPGADANPKTPPPPLVFLPWRPPGFYSAAAAQTATDAAIRLTAAVDAHTPHTVAEGVGGTKRNESGVELVFRVSPLSFAAGDARVPGDDDSKTLTTPSTPLPHESDAQHSDTPLYFPSPAGIAGIARLSRPLPPPPPPLDERRHWNDALDAL